MHYNEAIAVLKLTWFESWDESAIKRSWKKIVKTTHPDKHTPGSTNATLITQQLNEAKDTLIGRLTNHDDKKKREDEEERLAREKELAEIEAKHNAEMDNRRERFTRNRRKRLPLTRVHRKSEDNKEGSELRSEMLKFFKENFLLSTASKIAVSEILNRFITSRYHTTKLEIDLSKRHCKRIFHAAWPTAVYYRNKDNRFFLYVDAKN
jgi:curved DNA-binding protein CbpA